MRSKKIQNGGTLGRSSGSVRRPYKTKAYARRARAGSGGNAVLKQKANAMDGRCYRNLLAYFLRVYLDTREYIRRTKQRLKCMDKSTVIGKWPREQEWSHIEVYEAHKNEIKHKLVLECRKSSDHRWLRKFPGIGTVGEAVLLSKVDIHKADTISSLWRFCGLGVEGDGTRQRPKRGEKRNYCALLKSILLHDVGNRTLMSKRRPAGHKVSRLIYPEYRAVYDQSKKLYAKHRPGWTKLHIHNAAVRRMVKEWLKHLWVRWRTEHGLSVTSGFSVGRVRKG